MNLDLKSKRAGEEAPQKEIRCRCGSLVAKQISSGIEVKCRRCKRIAVLSWESLRENPGGLKVTL